jgi:hypothetical protein
LKKAEEIKHDKSSSKKPEEAKAEKGGKKSEEGKAEKSIPKKPDVNKVDTKEQKKQVVVEEKTSPLQKAASSESKKAEIDKAQAKSAPKPADVQTKPQTTEAPAQTQKKQKAPAPAKRKVPFVSKLPMSTKANRKDALLKKIDHSLAELKALPQKLGKPNATNRQTDGDSEDPLTLSERFLALKNEAMTLKKTNNDLNVQNAILNRRILKAQEKSKMYPKSTTIVPSSLEVFLFHLGKYSSKTSISNEFGKGKEAVLYAATRE